MENAKATGLKLKSPLMTAERAPLPMLELTLVESQALNHCRQASAQF
jgi:hypothetical protein